MEATRLLDDKYLRLVYCLIETCSKSARRLLLFYLEKSRPLDLNGREWTIDDFLYENRERLPKLNPSQHVILFPGRNINTDINKWDISLLFIVLEMFNLDSVITKDCLAIKKTRNRIFHANSTSIEDVKYEEYKEKISVYVKNCCDILDDQTLASEIEDIFKEAEGTKINKETQTRVMSDFDNWFKSEQLFDCNDRIPSEIGSIMDALFENIVNVLGQFRYEIPDTYLSLQISSCSLAQSDEISKQLLQFMSEDISPQENESQLGKAISTAKSALIDKHRKLVEIKQGCLILRIQSEDLEGFWCLISDCISGKLTASWRDVQNVVREEHGAPYLRIEVGVTASEIINCVEELVQNISESISNQKQMSLSTKHAILEEEATKEQTYEEGNEEARLCRAEYDLIRGYGSESKEALKGMIRRKEFARPLTKTYSSLRKISQMKRDTGSQKASLCGKVNKVGAEMKERVNLEDVKEQNDELKKEIEILELDSLRHTSERSHISTRNLNIQSRRRNIFAKEMTYLEKEIEILKDVTDELGMRMKTGA